LELTQKSKEDNGKKKTAFYYFFTVRYKIEVSVRWYRKYFFGDLQEKVYIKMESL